MTRAEIIHSLTECLRGNGTSNCKSCPHNKSADYSCQIRLRNDIIALLDAQEPLAPIVQETDLSRKYGDAIFKYYYCAKCNHPLAKALKDVPRDDYCPKCGQAVKWE